MNIEQLMQDIVDEPAPPSALRADDVYNAGRRRLRRNHRTYGGLLVATVLASAGIVGANAQPFDSAPPAPATDERDDSSASVDSKASADTEADTSADASTDTEAGGSADGSTDTEAGGSADVSAEATASDPLPEPSAPALPSLPPLDCDGTAATVRAELAAQGLDAEDEADVRCEDGTVVVAVTITAEPVQTDLTVEVALAEAAAIEDIVCAGGASCEETAAGLLASADGEAALGRSDGLVVRTYADLEQSVGLQGEIDAVPSTAQLRELALTLGESLTTP